MTEVIARDNKRTNVRAFRIDKFKFHAPLGACYWNPGDQDMNFVCPGCGRWGGIYQRESNGNGIGWNIIAGSFEKPETLTVQPSIRANCCGWHGYLTDGVFLSCD